MVLCGSVISPIYARCNAYCCENDSRILCRPIYQNCFQAFFSACYLLRAISLRVRIASVSYSTMVASITFHPCCCCWEIGTTTIGPWLLFSLVGMRHWTKFSDETSHWSMCLLNSFHFSSLCIRIAEAEFVLMAIFHSRSSWEVIFFGVVSNFIIEMRMEIDLSFCENSSIDICSDRKSHDLESADKVLKLFPRIN